MFQFSKDEDSITVRVTGDTRQALEEIAATLELNVQWPVFPLALNNMYRICRAHSDTDEKLRDIVMLDSKENEGMFLFDIEALKVEAKKMEISGLTDKGEQE